MTVDLTIDDANTITSRWVAKPKHQNKQKSISKAATFGGEVTYFPIARITKYEKAPNGSLRIYGKVTDDSLDLDQQIIDSEFSRRALREWMGAWKNIRQMHSASLPPAGVGIDMEEKPDGFYLTAEIYEPGAMEHVRRGGYKAFSVGIAMPRVVRDNKAKNGRIIDGKIVEVSLVDMPANPGTRFSLVAKQGLNPDGAMQAIFKSVKTCKRCGGQGLIDGAPCAKCGGKGMATKKDEDDEDDDVQGADEANADDVAADQAQVDAWPEDKTGSPGWQSFYGQTKEKGMKPKKQLAKSKKTLKKRAKKAARLQKRATAAKQSAINAMTGQRATAQLQFEKTLKKAQKAKLSVAKSKRAVSRLKKRAKKASTKRAKSPVVEQPQVAPEPIPDWMFPSDPAAIDAAISKTIATEGWQQVETPLGAPVRFEKRASEGYLGRDRDQTEVHGGKVMIENEDTLTRVARMRAGEIDLLSGGAGLQVGPVGNEVRVDDKQQLHRQLEGVFKTGGTA